MRSIAEATIVAAIVTATSAAHAEKPYTEYSIRVGQHTTEMVRLDDAPHGSGLTAEVVVARRFNRWLSIGGFAAVARFHDTTMDAFDPEPVYDHQFRALEIGARFSVHAGPVFAGVGIGIEKRESGYTFDEGSAWGFGELHAGIRSPRIPGLRTSVEVMALYGRGTAPWGDHVDTKRLSIGVTF